jgi:glycosyltransferase involved in cell wall biosynthesis
MDRQSMKPDQWIVADDGVDPQPVSMGQQVIRRHRCSEGARSLADNIIAAVDHVRGDYVGIIENDDYYFPNHIEVQIEQLQKHRATGCRWLKYFNIEHRSYAVIKNSCSALCNTFFRVELLEDLRKAAIECRKNNDYNIDGNFWRRVGYGGLHDTITVIGIKGLKGRKGLGVGHRPQGMTKDRDFAKLKEWIGNDSNIYTA